EYRAPPGLENRSRLPSQRKNGAFRAAACRRSHMSPRTTRGTVVLIVILILLGAGTFYVARGPLAPVAARAVEPRGELSEAERWVIGLFERVSPSVVQIVARAAANPFEEDEGGQGGQSGQGRAASGTGFVWDAAGHVVTNDHVVQGAAGTVSIRLAS